METAMVNGVRLSFEDRGGNGAPLLLVCATGMQASAWDLTGLRPMLDDAGYRTIAFDNRGMPPSGVTPPPYTVEQPAFIVGFSLGANITQTID
jgi:pimeloyl-ACP methyl ester carboxylesterase